MEILELKGRITKIKKKINQWVSNILDTVKKIFKLKSR